MSETKELSLKYGGCTLLTAYIMGQCNCSEENAERLMCAVMDDLDFMLDMRAPDTIDYDEQDDEEDSDND